MDYGLILTMVIIGQIGYWIGFFTARKKFRHPVKKPSVSKNKAIGSVDLTGMNNVNSRATIDNTTTNTTTIKAGWYSDNFNTYYLDENGVKHYR